MGAGYRKTLSRSAFTRFSNFYGENPEYMRITGKLFVNGHWVDGAAGSYQAINPECGKKIKPKLSMASLEQVDTAVRAAESAAPVFRNSSLETRAGFLRACADEIMALGDELIERVSEETGYPAARGEMERGRTCSQLRLFADTILTGDYLDACIDTALPDRQPLPRPDLRRMNQAIGPVVVFGASNFPLAFSVAGGDTAAAFAAGCPVLVKGHSSHPGVSELVAQAIATAVSKCNLPAGVFSLLMGPGPVIGEALVKAPPVKAVGFTGSYTGGTTLVEIANARPDPIPVFAEMGSINPVVLLPEALKQSADSIASGFIGSLTLGTGQFCVNPGLVIALEDESLNDFLNLLVSLISEVDAGVMLNNHISNAYRDGIEKYKHQEGVDTVCTGAGYNGKKGYRGQATLLSVTAAQFLRNPELQEEIFGPASLIVRCRDRDEITRIISMLRGQLTATVHCAEGELEKYPELTDLLTLVAGRIVINGFPTGVEVCHAMVHGGPFPASTDSRFTSVGTSAIRRFIRPVCYQNFPEHLLPDALRNDNPLGITRLVNGVKTDAPVIT